MSLVSHGVFTDAVGRRFVLVAEGDFSALQTPPILTPAEHSPSLESVSQPSPVDSKSADAPVDEDNFGKLVSELRIAKMPELTQERLCELSGVTQATISHVETGVTKARKSTRTKLIELTSNT